MEIFRGRAKNLRGRGRGGSGRSGRGSDRRRRDNPLADLITEEKTTAAVSSGTRRKKSQREGGLLASIGLGHVAFLLVGLVLGATVFLTVNFIIGLRQPKEEAKPPAEETVAKPPAPPPAPRVYRAATPTEAVRMMLKASVEGDTEIAYSLWDIRPDEVATLRQGQAITLAELTAKAAQQGGSASFLAQLNFSVKQQRGDEAQVVQSRNGAISQIYTLRRTGGSWKIVFASPH